MRVKIDADVFLFDLDGTIYLGDQPIGDAINTLKKLEKLGKKIYFLTNNSSKNKSEYIVKLTKMGYPVVAEQILTSTMATVYFLLQNRKGKSVFPIGTDAFVSELKAANIPISDNADIVLLAFDTAITYDKLWKANILLDKGSEFIATHPDKVCPSDIGNMPDVGSLCALLQCSSGKAPSVICGKPYSAMADIISCFVKTPKERIVMVGDRLYTDILFGINSGYQSLAVLSGEITQAMLDDSTIKPTHVLPTVNDLILE